MINFSLSQSLRINAQIAELERAKFDARGALRAEILSNGNRRSIHCAILPYCRDAAEHEDRPLFADLPLLAALCGSWDSEAQQIRPGADRIFLSMRALNRPDNCPMNLADRLHDLAAYWRAQSPRIDQLAIASALCEFLGLMREFRRGDCIDSLCAEYCEDRGLFADLYDGPAQRIDMILAALEGIAREHEGIKIRELARAQFQFQSGSDDLLSIIADMGSALSAGY